MGKRIGFGIYQSSRNRGSVGRVSVFGLQRYRWGVGGGLGQDLDLDLDRWGGVMTV